MNRHPRLETVLIKLRIPEYMVYLAQPAADRVRHVRRREQQAVATKASGALLTAQTVELVPADSSLAAPDPAKASPVFDPAPISPEDQN